MGSDMVDTGRRGARFHFDPLHDVSTVPSIDELTAWAIKRAAVPQSAMNVAMKSVHESRAGQMTIIGRFLRLVPSLERRRRAEVDRVCIEAIRREIAEVRSTMLEFGVDLTTHALLWRSLEAIMSYAVMSPIEREQRAVLDQATDCPRSLTEELAITLDQIDTERRIAASHAGIRATLENEALMAIMEHDDFIRDRDRHIGALKAAVDEMRQVDMRQRLVDMIARVEASRQ